MTILPMITAANIREAPWKNGERVRAQHPDMIRELERLGFHAERRDGQTAVMRLDFPGWRGRDAS